MRIGTHLDHAQAVVKTCNQRFDLRVRFITILNACVRVSLLKGPERKYFLPVKIQQIFKATQSDNCINNHNYAE